MSDEETGTPVREKDAEEGNAAAAASAAAASPPYPSSDHNNHEHNHHSHIHGYQRLYKLLHPSGKIFHIVHSPHEVEPKRHAILSENPKSVDFDVVIHGTDEHLNVVRDCHQDRTKSRDAMVSSNRELLERYEKVRLELDALSRELHTLTDHAVALDASFDKWGYSAKLRTTSDGETASVDPNGSSQDLSKYQDRTLSAIRFWKAPVIRQYFHKGLIWRSPHASEVYSSELFIDLVYVAVIDVIGEVAVTNASGASFLHYVIVFCISSKTFNDATLIMNWFEINDIFGRLSVMLIVICLYCFALNTEYFFELTYTAGLSFYLASRFFVAFWFFFTAWITKMVRWSLVAHGVTLLIAAAFWIASIHVEYPRNLPLIFIAVVVDLLGNLVYMPVVRFLAHRYKNNKALNAMVEYLPAINIEHRVDRTGAFISLVIGYLVIKIFFQSHAEFPMNAFLGKGVLGLIQAYTFNWIYFEIDASALHVHAIRRHWVSAGLWNLMHIPFSAAFILAASTLPELVLAHDCSDADPENLAETYALLSREELDPALRWFYCGGLGVALLSMSVIALCHVHKKLPNAKLSKRMRLAYRAAVAITIICLPLAGPSLSSLDLITVTACLVASVLIVDIFGNTCAGDQFWTGGFCRERRRRTQYTARCQVSGRLRNQMRRAVQRGEKLDLDQIVGRKELGASVSSFESAETRVGGEAADVDRNAGAY